MRRIRGSENDHEEPRRQTSHLEEDAVLPRDEVRDDDHGALFRNMARAQADGRSASFVGGRRQADSVSGQIDFKARFPENPPLHTVTNLNDRKSRVALALVQASGYGDLKEVRWFWSALTPLGPSRPLRIRAVRFLGT